MPVISSFDLSQSENGTITITLTPPTNIASWHLRFTMSRRQGGQPLVSKSMGPGYTTGQSGMTMVNASIGIFTVSFAPEELSGLDPGLYFYEIDRVDSGSISKCVMGYRIIGY